MADHDKKMLIRKWELWQADHGISAYPSLAAIDAFLAACQPPPAPLVPVDDQWGGYRRQPVATPPAPQRFWRVWEYPSGMRAVCMEVDADGKAIRPLSGYTSWPTPAEAEANYHCRSPESAVMA